MSTQECRHPASGLLPWYVSGSLQDTERDWVRGHVQSCDTCARECDELARSREAIATTAARGGRRRVPWVAAAVLAIPLAVGLFLAWARTAGFSPDGSVRLDPAVYLDLGAGPTRAVDPLRSLEIPPEAGSVVISLLVPGGGQGRYTLDLEGPQGAVLVRQAPIRDVDATGRCIYAFPASLLSTAGEYAIVVRVVTSDGDTRLYPYPFVVGLRVRS